MQETLKYHYQRCNIIKLETLLSLTIGPWVEIATIK
jgi:hypothetical protein